MRRIGCAARIVVMVALIAFATPGAAAARLDEPPLDFTVSPRLVTPDETIGIRVAPAPAARWQDTTPLDVYVMWATTERAAFLGPDGAWSPIPVPVRRDMQPTTLPVTVEWRRPGPAGNVPLAMVAVPSGADPLLRSDWRYRPVLQLARVAAAGRRSSVDVAVASSVLLATALAILVVAIMPWSPQRGAQQAGDLDPARAVRRVSSS